MTSEPDPLDAVLPIRGSSERPRQQQAPGPGAKATPARPFTTLNAASLAGQAPPERQWHVEGLIPARQVTIITGDGGAGKSLILKQLMASTALGSQWLGLDTAAGLALFLTAEDDRDEVHRRLCDVARHLNADLADLDRLELLSLAGEDALLAVPDKAGMMVETPLFQALDRWMGEHRPQIVGLDTAADIFGGHENDRGQVRQFVGMLRGLAIRHDAAVVLASHPSLTGMASGTGNSGSTAWNNSVRSRLYLQRIKEDGHEPDPDARVLSTVKSNYSRSGLELTLHWRDGVFEADPKQTSLDRMATNAKAERVFLKLLRQFADEGRNVNHAGGRSYAPSIFAEHPDREGVSRRALTAAMHSLFAAKRITSETYGPPSKRATRIVEVQPDA